MQKIFTVYDSKAAAYLNPFHARTAGEAIRMFQGSVNDPKSNISQHPEDYTLFELGEYDESKGDIIPSESKKSLGTAIDYVKEQ